MYVVLLIVLIVAIWKPLAALILLTTYLIGRLTFAAGADAMPTDPDHQIGDRSQPQPQKFQFGRRYFARNSAIETDLAPRPPYTGRPSPGRDPRPE
jgi:hypothetical protein